MSAGRVHLEPAEVVERNSPPAVDRIAAVERARQPSFRLPRNSEVPLRATRVTSPSFLPPDFRVASTGGSTRSTTGTTRSRAAAWREGEVRRGMSL